ncbi:hypothetical protein WNY78_00750 [Psychroserpens sp. AS72]|uniref:hypothetical protein n=1 Tax=Psychroserpens sp. AS72 TaxID=3135775 RepID=UPI00317662CF
MRKIIATLVLTLILFSCGTKATAKKESTNSGEVEEMLTYSSNIIGNKTLVQKKFKGALTDEKSFEDVGTFEYTTYYDAKKKQLVLIENLEITEKKVLENYYYKNDELYYIAIWDPYMGKSKIGDTIKMKMILPNDKAKDSEKTKIYFNKAKIFKDAFYKNL